MEGGILPPISMEGGGGDAEYGPGGGMPGYEGGIGYPVGGGMPGKGTPPPALPDHDRSREWAEAYAGKGGVV
ncbi:MAG: hypothetical protein SGARI_007390 [Bacillariaceae sp.]